MKMVCGDIDNIDDSDSILLKDSKNLAKDIW